MNPLDVFNKIRDIPYKISLDFLEENNACSGKVIKLKQELEKLGVKCRFRVCEFKWSDLNLPQDILSMPHSDLAAHVYLEAKINNCWTKLDPTWDSGLSKIFPISEWNGKSGTILAVKPIKTFALDDSDKIMTATESQKEFDEDISINGKFYTALNDYFNRGRAKNNHQSD